MTHIKPAHVSLAAVVTMTISSASSLGSRRSTACRALREHVVLLRWRAIAEISADDATHSLVGVGVRLVQGGHRRKVAHGGRAKGGRVDARATVVIDGASRTT